MQFQGLLLILHLKLSVFPHECPLFSKEDNINVACRINLGDLPSIAAEDPHRYVKFRLTLQEHSIDICEGFSDLNVIRLLVESHGAELADRVRDRDDPDCDRYECPQDRSETILAVNLETWRLAKHVECSQRLVQLMTNTPFFPLYAIILTLF